jgi:hypothetical protein
MKLGCDKETLVAFRRNGKLKHSEGRSWNAWWEKHEELLRATGLPQSVLRSRKDWNYLLFYGYHCNRAYPNIDFTLEELSAGQRTAFRQLLEAVLSEEEKQRGSPGWHFVCPPVSEDGGPV